MIDERRRYLSYLLRLWQERDALPAAWRASLEDPRTGERLGFPDIAQLFAYLEEQLAGEIVPGIPNIPESSKQKSESSTILSDFCLPTDDKEENTMANTTETNAEQSSPSTPTFDPVKYKDTTRQQWQTAAEAWYRWGPTLHEWLGPATETMLDLAGIGPGSKVLDVAAGAGEQTLAAARRVAPTGFVLATDISSNILEFCKQSAHEAGLANIETRVMDGENLELDESSFDAVISRVGLIYFPDQQKALTGMRRVLKPGGRVAAIVYSTPDNNKFFSIPISIIRRRAQLPPPLPGQPGPFSLGNQGTLEAAYEKAGLREVQIQVVPSPLRLSSAAECVHFERASFGALHQMMSGLSEEERDSVWAEIEQELRQFEGPGGFEGPCEMIVGVATR
jgi:ubiquinone/menaquinone biosynthesis C-methylase UbiE